MSMPPPCLPGIANAGPAPSGHAEPRIACDEKLIWTGRIVKGSEPDSVKGWLFNRTLGQRISFTGCRDLRRGGGYLLIGRIFPGEEK